MAHRFLPLPRLLFGLMVVVIPFAVGHSEIVKCRDAQGHWHYGDRADPACGQRKVYILNREGVQVREVSISTQSPVGTAVSPQAQADRRLLASYSSTTEIERIRDRRISDLEKERQATGETLNILEQTLAHMESVAALSKKPEPTLQRDIRETETQISAEQQVMQSTATTEKASRTDYDQQIKRYRDLSSKSSP